MKNLEEKAPLQTLPAPSSQENRPDAVESTPPENQPSIEISNPDNERQLQESSRAASLNRQVSVTPPLPPKNAHITPPPTPLRGITTVAPLPMPDAPPPPRPDSIYREAEATNTTSTVESSQRLIGSSSGSNDGQSLKVPKRKYSEKGLEEDDPVGRFLSFVWWFLFILARVFAIAVAYEFYPMAVLAVLGVHYAAMLIYLFYYSKYYDAITCLVNLWLGLVYVFSLIEYRIKFKYADWWTLPYYILVIAQNTALTLSWYVNADWDGFWYTYIFCAIFVSMVLCVVSSLMYHAMFKPKKCRVYSS